MSKTNVGAPKKSSDAGSRPSDAELNVTRKAEVDPGTSKANHVSFNSSFFTEYVERYGLLFLLALAFVLRVVLLNWKSPHFDESINGHFVAEIWKTGFYKYDPTNFHGPLYFYLLHFSELLLGKGVYAFRFVTVLMSTAIVYVVWAHARYLGRVAIVAALVVALSPAMVFYGRYAIHETLFVLCHVVFSYGFLKWRAEGGTRSIAYMLGSTTAAIATKETFFIFTGTWMIAWAMTRAAEKLWPTKTSLMPSVLTPAGKTGGSRTWFTVALCCAMILGALFSGFFAYPEGMRDMIRAYSFWTKTGTGATGHEKPFLYWLELLKLYEWPCLLALVLAPLVCLFSQSSAWMRHFSLNGFGSWLAYSIIPYKTPWCILSVIWPLAFVLGFLVCETGPRVAGLIAKRPQKPNALTLIWFGAPVLALVASIWIMLRLNFRDFENPQQRYVYVQSTQDVPRIMGFLHERIRQHPEDLTVHIQVLNKDSWPFPWLLNRFTHVDYGNVSPETVIVADVIFADQSDVAVVEQKLNRRYWRRPLAIRDAYQPGYAYFDYNRFQSVIPASSESVGPAPVSDPTLRAPAAAEPGRTVHEGPAQRGGLDGELPDGLNGGPKEEKR